MEDSLDTALETFLLDNLDLVQATGVDLADPDLQDKGLDLAFLDYPDLVEETGLDLAEHDLQDKGLDLAFLADPYLVDKDKGFDPAFFDLDINLASLVDLDPYKQTGEESLVSLQEELVQELNLGLTQEVALGIDREGVQDIALWPVHVAALEHFDTLLPCLVELGDVVLCVEHEVVRLVLQGKPSLQSTITKKKSIGLISSLIQAGS